MEFILRWQLKFGVYAKRLQQIAEKVKGTVFIYDLSTGKKSSDLTASAYCEADKSGGGKNSLCNPKDKKPVDYGIRYKFDWARCDKQNPCNQVPFEKVEVGTHEEAEGLCSPVGCKVEFEKRPLSKVSDRAANFFDI